MGRAVVQACLPWLSLLLVSFAFAYLLVRLNRSRIELGRLRALHGDQSGAVQSLSFVLTLPIFVMVMLLIVQVSQLMIGTIVVHYAAFAAARSAIVWIPARLGYDETENCISSYHPDPEAVDQVLPVLDPLAPDYGPSEGGMTYEVVPGGPKHRKITTAAVMACMPISPSRDLGLEVPGESRGISEIAKTLYGSLATGAAPNGRIPRRLENKLAYAMEATEIEIRFYHTYRHPEPPLVSYPHLDDDRNDLTVEFMSNELGWQDPITVKVKHQLALLPGPGRLLARRVRSPDGSPDRVAEKIGRTRNVYVYPLEASATMDNEGEKSVIPYQYTETGLPYYGPVGPASPPDEYPETNAPEYRAYNP